MRKTFVILSLVAVTLVACASEAFAQRLRIGGRNGLSINLGGSGYGSGYYGSGYGSGYYGSGYRYGSPWYGSSYYSSPGYFSSPGYYYSTPSYYYSSPNYYYSEGPSIDTRQSAYYDPNSATITVQVPNANAEVWFDDSPTSQRGMERLFHTPALQPGGGTYMIRAKWVDNGRVVDQTRQIDVRPGQSATVSFRAENVPSPRP